MKVIHEYFGLGGGISQMMLLGTLMVMRIIPIIFQTPILGGKLVPAETRIGLSVGVSILAYPYARNACQGPIDTNSIVYMTLMMKELFIGYTIGFTADVSSRELTALSTCIRLSQNAELVLRSKFSSASPRFRLDVVLVWIDS